MEEHEAAEVQEIASRVRPRGAARIRALLRALLILGLLVLFVWALWQGGWLALLAWILTVIVLADTTANVIFMMYNGKEWRRWGILFWVASVFLGVKGVQVVTKDAQIKSYQPPGPLANVFARVGAPGIVVVDNGMAVVFERSGRFTRVQGPGLAFTQRFEFPAHLVDLRRQLRSREVKKTMTRDGLSFDLKRLDIFFEVASEFDPHKGEYSFSEEAVLDVVYRGGTLYEKGEQIDWRDRVAREVEYRLRNVAGRHTLADLVRGDEASARQRFIEEVEGEAGPSLRQMGVHLIGIDVGEIEMPEELRDLLSLPLKQIVDLGWAHTQRDAIIGISEGLRHAISRIEATMPDVGAESRPHLLLNLTDILRRILEESLRLAASYRELPEGHALLPGGEGLTGTPPEKPGRRTIPPPSRRDGGR